MPEERNSTYIDNELMSDGKLDSKLYELELNDPNVDDGSIAQGAISAQLTKGLNTSEGMKVDNVDSVVQSISTNGGLRNAPGANDDLIQQNQNGDVGDGSLLDDLYSDHIESNYNQQNSAVEDTTHVQDELGLFNTNITQNGGNTSQNTSGGPIKQDANTFNTGGNNTTNTNVGGDTTNNITIEEVVNNTVEDVVENIQNIFNDTVLEITDNVVNEINNLFEDITDIDIDNITTDIENIVNNVAGDVINEVYNTLSTVNQTIDNTVSEIINILPTEITNTVTNLIDITETNIENITNIINTTVTDTLQSLQLDVQVYSELYSGVDTISETILSGDIGDSVDMVTDVLSDTYVSVDAQDLTYDINTNELLDNQMVQDTIDQIDQVSPTESVVDQVNDILPEDTTQTLQDSVDLNLDAVSDEHLHLEDGILTNDADLMSLTESSALDGEQNDTETNLTNASIVDGTGDEQLPLLDNSLVSQNDAVDQELGENIDVILGDQLDLIVDDSTQVNDTEYSTSDLDDTLSTDSTSSLLNDVFTDNSIEDQLNTQDNETIDIVNETVDVSSVDTTPLITMDESTTSTQIDDVMADTLSIADDSSQISSVLDSVDHNGLLI